MSSLSILVLTRSLEVTGQKRKQSNQTDLFSNFKNKSWLQKLNSMKKYISNNNYTAAISLPSFNFLQE
jgi:hypothetical protein